MADVVEINKAKIIKHYLPTYADMPQEQQGWVECADGLTTPQVMALLDKNEELKNSSLNEMLYPLVTAAISAWNLGENGVVLPITEENVRKLHGMDFMFLVMQLGFDKLKMNMIKKNNSFSTLTEEKSMPEEKPLENQTPQNPQSQPSNG